MAQEIIQIYRFIPEAGWKSWFYMSKSDSFTGNWRVLEDKTLEVQIKHEEIKGIFKKKIEYFTCWYAEDEIRFVYENICNRK